MNGTRTTDLIIAFAGGLLAGAATAVLLTPTSGRETRQRIAELGQKATNMARGKLDEAREFTSDQKRRLSSAIQEGREAYEREASTSNS